jgi:cysteine desulfurase
MSTHPGLDGEPIYLDYNATTPIDPAVVAAMQPYLTTGFGNPSSAHRYATIPAAAHAALPESVRVVLIPATAL